MSLLVGVRRALQRHRANRLAAKATAAMARLHGDQWALTIDHANRFILIQPRRAAAKVAA